MTSGLRSATNDDAPAITKLVNNAFQKESFFKKGDRTDLAQVLGKMNIGSFYLLEEGGEPLGCVYLETAKQGDDRRLAKGEGAGYIGMLAVDPAHQGRGLGHLLMQFAEKELVQRGCKRIQIRIVNLRTELHVYYSRMGYRETGTTPYPFPDKTTQPIHFIDMEKDV